MKSAPPPLLPIAETALARPSIQAYAPPPPITPPSGNNRRLKKLLALREQRSMEALKLYEMVPAAKAFHESPAKTRIALGGNRSSKSTASAVDLVMRMLGVHPTYKTAPNGERIYGLGQDQQHISKTMWPKLYHPGQFKIIQDEETGKWRTVRPDNEYDKAYREKWRDAPPLVTDRMLLGGRRGIAWEAKNKDIPRSVTFRNGSILTFYTSNGPPRRGFSITGAWLDEEQENEQWIFEIYRGLTDTGGWMIYSATPQSGSHWLYTKWQEATSPFNDGKRIAGFKFLMRDNPFIPQAEKERFLADLGNNEREKRVRWDGEFELDSRLVYSGFQRETHVVEQFWPDRRWNRYLVVDPGIATAAVMFIAVAPDTTEEGGIHPYAGEVHVYNELYLQKCGAQAVAERVKQAIELDPNAERSGDFVAFIIDGHAGRQTQMGSGRTIQSDYRDAFRELGLSSRLTGSDFLHGSDDVKGREEALHRLLERVPHGDELVAKFKVHTRCRSLIWEFPQQARKKTRDGVVLDTREKVPDHAVVGVEYFADYYPGWLYFPPPRVNGNRLYNEFQKRKKKTSGSTKVRLGPPE